MSTAVVFYSLEGHTEKVAEQIAKALDADLIRLRTVKEYPVSGPTKYLMGGRDALVDRQAALLPYEFDADKYNTVILATPVWAGHATPAMNRFLRDNRLTGKRIGLVIVSMTGREGAIDDLKTKLAGRRDISSPGVWVSELSIVAQKDGLEEGSDAKIALFCDQMAQICKA